MIQIRGRPATWVHRLVRHLLRELTTDRIHPRDVFGGLKVPMTIHHPFTIVSSRDKFVYREGTFFVNPVSGAENGRFDFYQPFRFVLWPQFVSGVKEIEWAHRSEVERQT